MLSKHVAVVVLGIAVLAGCMDQPAHPSVEPENTSARHNGIGFGSGNRSEPDTTPATTSSEKTAASEAERGSGGFGSGH